MIGALGRLLVPGSYWIAGGGFPGLEAEGIEENMGGEVG